MNNHCMVDLETTGVDPGCCILTIGAVVFDKNFTELSTFESAIKHHESLRFGFTDDADTLMWWLQQPKIAHDAAFSGKYGPDQILQAFADWLSDHDVKYIWGNGASFDNAILEAAYKKLDIEIPWKFYNNRCYRTIKSLRPSTVFERVGVHHKALDDAISQLRHMKKIYNVTGMMLE